MKKLLLVILAVVIVAPAIFYTRMHAKCSGGNCGKKKTTVRVVRK